MRKKDMLKKTITFFVVILLSINFACFSAEKIGLLSDMRVCVDAGWGINKSKKIANTATEANLRIAYFLQEMLEEEGAYVVMTDDTLDLKSGEIDSNLLFLRATKIARGEKCSMVITIQHGGSLDKDENYFSVIYEPQTNLKIKEYTVAIATILKQALNRPNKSLKDIDNLAAFSKTDVPIIYINCGLITNKQERKDLKKIDYCRLKAQAIFDGIIKANAVLKSKISSTQVSSNKKSNRRSQEKIIPPPMEEEAAVIISEDINEEDESIVISDDQSDTSLIDELPPPEVASLPVAEAEEPVMTEADQLDYQPIEDIDAKQEIEQTVEPTVNPNEEVDTKESVEPTEEPKEPSPEEAVKEATEADIQPFKGKPALKPTKQPEKLPDVEPIAEPVEKPVEPKAKPETAPQSKPIEQVVEPVPAPQPTPTPVAEPVVAQAQAQPETQQTIVSEYKDGQYYPFNPPFPSPVDAQIDNSWLYGERFTQDTFKKGVSFITPKGTPVKAIADGIVDEINRSKYISKTAPYKRCVVLKHNDPYNGDTVYSIYGKLPIIKVKKGQAVKKGEIIGFTGEPYAGKGSSRLEEFEFEIRFGVNLPESRQNPELLIKQINSEGLGAIAGKVLKKTGKTAASVRIMRFIKPAGILNYGYTKSYTLDAVRSKGFDENYAATCLMPGKYIITTKYGKQEVEIKPNELLYFNIREK